MLQSKFENLWYLDISQYSERAINNLFIGLKTINIAGQKLSITVDEIDTSNLENFKQLGFNLFLPSQSALLNYFLNQFDL